MSDETGNSLAPDQPDLTKPLSRFNSLYFAVMHGVAAALECDARWAVFSALCCHLPNVAPGKDRIERLTGLSRSTVWSATKALKAVGLIDYDDTNRGGLRRTNCYRIADIRQPDIAAQIVAKI